MDERIERNPGPATSPQSANGAKQKTVEKFNHDEERGKLQNLDFPIWILIYACCTRNIYMFYYFHETCGGAAVFLTMIIFYFFLSNPTFYAQSFMGQFSSTGFLSVYRVCPLFKGLGYIILLYNVFSATYFSVITAYPLAYIYKLFSYVAPWNQTNSIPLQLQPHWMQYANWTTFNNKSQVSLYFLKQINDLYSERGWRDVNMSGAIIFVVVLVWICIALSHIKGLQSVSQVKMFLIAISFILTLTFFGRPISSFGDVPTFTFFESTDIKKLKEFKSWAMAIVMIFCSFGKSHGVILTMASHNNFRQSLRDTSSGLSSMVMIFCVMNIFMIRSFTSFMKSIGINEEAAKKGGFNLAFLLWPDYMAYAGSSQAWTGFWYVFLFVIDFMSVLVQVFAITSSLFDEFPRLRNWRKVTVGGLCAILCCFGIYIGSGGLFPPVDKLFFYGLIAQMLITIVELVVFSWNWLNFRRFEKDEFFTFGSQNYGTRFFIYITPFVILMGMIWMCVDQWDFLPKQIIMWPYAMTVAFFVLLFLVLPGYMVFNLFWNRQGTLSERLRQSLKPQKWHPADPEEFKKFVAGVMPRSASDSEDTDDDDENAGEGEGDKNRNKTTS